MITMSLVFLTLWRSIGMNFDFFGLILNIYITKLSTTPQTCKDF